MSDKQTLGFQTEVKQLLHLMIHALYSNKEIFLRELVSNASDAADKLRFESLDNPALMAGDTELAVKICIDEKARTISISDNGIGMNRDEVISHLGTIAKSGTKDFLSQLSGDQSKDAALIGQFGVGFYSAFIVADKVTVRTLKAGQPADQAVEWVSKGEGDYSIESTNKDSRGTEIILRLRADESEFLNNWRLQHIVRKYSDHITIPVLLWQEPTKDEQGEVTKEGEWQQANKATALWTLPKNEISNEDYQAFYKHISHDFQEALTWAHNRVEGKQEYTSLLYIPAHAGFDLYNRDQHKGLKLYVKRVFIMDDADQFVPNYLRFVKGVLDSNDLPLNISREILQNNKVVDNLRSAVTKRVLGMLEKMQQDEPEQYKTFWQEFGRVLKEGVVEDFANKEQVAKLLRFSSTHTDQVEATVTLSDYINRMKSEQDKIYFITAETFNAAKNSPHLEAFRQRGLEVLILSDRIDEWVVTHLTDFDGKALQSVAKADIDLDKFTDEATKSQQEESSKNFEGVLTQIKTCLSEQIKEARITYRLTDSPACLVTDSQDMNPHMQKILQQAGQFIPESKPILELNPTHPFIEQLKNEQDDERFKEWSQILFDQALLAEGGTLDDPASFVKSLNKLMLRLI